MYRGNVCFVLRLAVLALVLALAGCVTAPVDSTRVLSEEEREQRWQAHQARLEQLLTWQTIGRLNLRVPGRSDTMSIDWNQQQDSYQLLLNGPFGAAVARISGDQHGVKVDASGETRYGPTPEVLLYSLTGWQFPVSNLRYWVRGLPAPVGNPRLNLNNLGYPEKIVQNGWTVVYQQYGAIRGQRLPTRLMISGGDVRLSLVLTDWVF